MKHLCAAFVTICLFVSGYARCGEPKAPAKAETPEEKKLREENARLKAEAAKKKAAEDKKKAEENKKKAEEAAKKADDPANWKPRDFEALTRYNTGLCVYIKDPDPKKNADATVLEGKDALANEELRQRLRPFMRIKIKNDGTNAKGWPADWLAKANSGAVLLLVSGDMKIVNAFDRNTKQLSPQALMTAADNILKYDAGRKAAADAKAKEEMAKATAAAKVAEAQQKKETTVPGLEPKKPEPKKKPASKEPVDE